MTRLAILAKKARTAAAALVLVTGVAQQLSAQAAAVLTGTVRNAATGTAVAGATVRAVGGTRSSVTGSDGSYRLAPDAGDSEMRVTPRHVAARARNEFDPSTIPGWAITGSAPLSGTPA